jgi:hypothetical protein
MAQTRLLHFLYAGEDCVDLESEAPSLWLGIVTFKHVDTFSTEILPVFDGLFDPDCLRDFGSENLQEYGLATSDVAFNCKSCGSGGFGSKTVGYGLD